MKAARFATLERVLVAILVSSFLWPLALAGWLRCSHDASSRTDWLRNATLAGTPYQPLPLESSLESVLVGKWQRALAQNYDHAFPGREFLIRVHNELDFRLFHHSRALVIGRDDTLYDDGHVWEYCLERTPKDVYRQEVADLRRLQDFCAGHGVAFALMITPNKASVYAEDLPAGWRHAYRPGLRRYESLVPLLQENGIHYVDGHRITLAEKAHHQLPLFPLGGLHWGDQGALATGNAVLSLLAGQGLPVRPITAYESRTTRHPRDGQDRDLANFLNKLIDLSYPVTEITPRPAAAGNGRHRPNLVIVGGSFDFKILKLFDRSDQFSEIDFLDYYTHSKRVELDGAIHVVSEPARPVDFATEVFAADALVLEMNEEAVDVLVRSANEPLRDWNPPNHISRFLHDALAALPAAGSPKLPFRYEGNIPYRWGDALSFVAGRDPVQIAGGFSAAANDGSFTDGVSATLRLLVPPAREDMELQVTAQPFLVDKRVTQQRVEVSINNHPLGEMLWSQTEAATRRVVVPKEFLGDGIVVVRFHLEDAASPAEIGLSSDYRKLGIRVSEMRFAPVSEDRAIYQWGETVSLAAGQNSQGAFQLNHFTVPGSDGVFTDGPVASIQFLAPPPSTDIVLRVKAGAFIAGSRLPAQQAEIRVNGHVVGRWSWTASEDVWHEASIPKEILSGGEARLEFHIARPASPEELGLGKDPRKLGIRISTIRLGETGK